MDINLAKILHDLWTSTGFVNASVQQILMLSISFLLMYLAIVKGFEPLLLVPIAFGMLLANLPGTGLMAPPSSVIDPATGAEKTAPGGLLWYLYQGVKLGIYPPLIFLGVGAMTDFGPLIANPKTLILGAAASWESSAPSWGPWHWVSTSRKRPPSALSAEPTDRRPFS